MYALISSALWTGTPLALVAYDVEALFMYGLLAAVLGLIGWSKYTEPAPSPAFPVAPRTPDPKSPAAGHEEL